MMKEVLTYRQKLKSILIAGIIMALGISIFKYGFMEVWGGDILYDASLHLTTAVFFLYVLWYFIDQNKSWRVPYFVFSGVVVLIVGIQRIIANAHNDIGLFIALIISSVAIIVSRWDYFRGKFAF